MNQFSQKAIRKRIAIVQHTAMDDEISMVESTNDAVGDFLPYDEDVILLAADNGKPTTNRGGLLNGLVFESPTAKLQYNSVNRDRLSSSGSSVSIPYSVPSFTKDDFPNNDAILFMPSKKTKHRRNRFVFASCSRKSSKTTTSCNKRENSTRRRKRNRAWNDVDFESFMGLKLFPK